MHVAALLLLETTTSQNMLWPIVAHYLSNPSSVTLLSLRGRSYIVNILFMVGSTLSIVLCICQKDIILT